MQLVHSVHIDPAQLVQTNSLMLLCYIAATYTLWSSLARSQDVTRQTPKTTLQHISRSCLWGTRIAAGFVGVDSAIGLQISSRGY